MECLEPYVRYGFQIVKQCGSMLLSAPKKNYDTDYDATDIRFYQYMG